MGLNNIFKEQIICESGIKCNSCGNDYCYLCDNIEKCYRDAITANNNQNENINHGGYETEMHY